MTRLFLPLLLFVGLPSLLSGCDELSRIFNTPYFEISSPQPGDTVETDTVQITGIVESPSAITALSWSLNGGQSVSVFQRLDAMTGAFTFPVAPLAPGNNVIVIAATNVDGYTGTTSLTVRRQDTPPAVTITSPTNGATVSGTSVDVTGTATDDHGIASLELRLNGSDPVDLLDTLTAGNAWATRVDGLVRGNNAIEVVAVDASGQRAVATVNVTAEGDDVPALRVEILSPEDGATVVGPDVTVSGAVAGEGIESVTVRLGERDAVDVTDTLSDAGAFVLSFESVDPGVWITLSVEAQAGDETASATISFMVEAPVEICENLIANASAERYEGEPIEEDGEPGDDDGEPGDDDGEPGDDDGEPGDDETTKEDDGEPGDDDGEPGDDDGEPGDDDGEPGDDDGEPGDDDGEPGDDDGEPGDDEEPVAPAEATALHWNAVRGELLSVMWGSDAGLAIEADGPGDRGSRLFTARTSETTARASQTLELGDLLNGGTMEDDADAPLGFYFEAWLGGRSGSEDTVRARVRFLTDGVLASQETLASATRSTDGLDRRTLTGEIPAGTTEIVVELLFDDEDLDGVIDAFADHLRFEVLQDGVCVGP
jgi:hypothetical protein